MGPRTMIHAKLIFFRIFFKKYIKYAYLIAAFGFFYYLQFLGVLIVLFTASVNYPFMTVCIHIRYVSFL